MSDSTQCPACEHELPHGASFCPSCGASQAIATPALLDVETCEIVLWRGYVKAGFYAVCSSASDVGGASELAALPGQEGPVADRGWPGPGSARRASREGPRRGVGACGSRRDVVLAGVRETHDTACAGRGTPAAALERSSAASEAPDPTTRVELPTAITSSKRETEPAPTLGRVEGLAGRWPVGFRGSTPTCCSSVAAA